MPVPALRPAHPGAPATPPATPLAREPATPPVPASSAPPVPGAAAPGDELPVIIQGGMGVAVSGWRLARAVASAGQLGVVSGVALDLVLARRLQLGDPGGTARHALAALPLPGAAERILGRYYVPGGIEEGQPFRPVPRIGLRGSAAGHELAVAGNFAEVYLAKEGHDGLVGVNYLEKVQLATPAAVYGAMLAGVDYVLMGAGIPAQIPRLLDVLAAGRLGELDVTVAGADPGTRHVAWLDPAELFPAGPPPLTRPAFLAIISSAVLAAYLARSPVTAPDGFVLEGPAAGGHSAPPRGKLVLSAQNEPVYGPRDTIELGKVRALGRPFWIAGGQVGDGQLAGARAAGAAGVQVGTAFALCRESGMAPALRAELLGRALAGTLSVRNEPSASPAGFPFKVAELPGTLADEAVYAARARLCDLGYLRVPYQRDGGRVGYRCPAEPPDAYQRKGGAAAETVGRRCLCNGLLATIGLGQRLDSGAAEPPVVTLGQDLGFLPGLVAAAGTDFTAADVLAYLLR